MNCCITLPEIPDIESQMKNGILRTSKKMKSGSNILKMIYKQHYIKQISHAGDGRFYDKDGSIKNFGKYKYRVIYDNVITGIEHIWVFE